MAQKLRYESPDRKSLITSRVRNEELWFVGNKVFVEHVLAYLAKYVALYGVIIYAFVLMGNHYHLVVRFPRANRTAFMRSFNSMITRLVKRHVKSYPGGTLWSRRYAEHELPEMGDVEREVYYCALQPVEAGLTERVGEYDGYNSFYHAAAGREQSYKLINWEKYENGKRHNSKLRPKDFEETYTLRYAKLPESEKKGVREYEQWCVAELEKRRAEIVKARRVNGQGFAGRKALSKTIPGSRPYKSKKSTRYSINPHALTDDPKVREFCDTQYFLRRSEYTEASKRFRAGDLTVKFPPGTYRPPQMTVVR